ncbi:hypothetical protein LTS18_009395 [Coniosporium uncinatum]|uniref:Uncharacterized protein n=1 Tax=Coniosporium uncinatum TaxID=93489 RepID=A0ACC3D0K6_9PEZI|nr:hypothetical protein LTS18_009395 [Coniosporium uncinatum]
MRPATLFTLAASAASLAHASPLSLNLNIGALLGISNTGDLTGLVSFLDSAVKNLTGQLQPYQNSLTNLTLAIRGSGDVDTDPSAYFEAALDLTTLSNYVLYNSIRLQSQICAIPDRSLNTANTAVNTRIAASITSMTASINSLKATVNAFVAAVRSDSATLSTEEKAAIQGAIAAVVDSADVALVPFVQYYNSLGSAGKTTVKASLTALQQAIVDLQAAASLTLN